MKILACAKPPIVNHKKWIKCSDCVYSKPTGDHKTVCTLFKYLIISEDNFYVDTIYCRSHFDLCGPYADFFNAKKEDHTRIIFGEPYDGGTLEL